jgi:hypothetical protein
MPVPATRAPFAGRTLARIRGIAGLGAIALLGRGLWEVGAQPPEAPEVERSEDPDGSTLIVLAGGPGLGGNAEIRVVLARVRVDLDEVRSIARVPGVGPRSIPRGSGTVLVSGDGSIALEPLLPRALIGSLLQAPPPARPALLRKLLGGYPALERVRRFWG